MTNSGGLWLFSSDLKPPIKGVLTHRELPIRLLHSLATPLRHKRIAINDDSSSELATTSKTDFFLAAAKPLSVTGAPRHPLLHMLQRAPVLVPQGPAGNIGHPVDHIWWIASELELAGSAIFVKCPDCCWRRSMSSIPHAMHAACKVHMNMEDGGMWQTTSFMEGKGNQKGGGEKATSWPTFPKMSQQFMDHPLAKYNSKLMNSIWGLYNRYSVHNFKRVTEEKMMGRADFALGKVQPNQASSASPGAVAGPAIPTASVPIRDASPLNTLWIGGHAH